MTDREKVIRGLEAHANLKTCETYAGEDCPYYNRGGSYPKVTCSSFLAADALALLREQEPRVMTLEEIQERAEAVDPDPVFVEWKGGATAWVLYTIDNIYYMAKRPYMGIRVWTSRPTPEQMWDTPWEGEDNG